MLSTLMRLHKEECPLVHVPRKEPDCTTCTKKPYQSHIVLSRKFVILMDLNDIKTRIKYYILRIFIFFHYYSMGYLKVSQQLGRETARVSNKVLCNQEMETKLIFPDHYPSTSS